MPWTNLAGIHPRQFAWDSQSTRREASSPFGKSSIVNHSDPTIWQPTKPHPRPQVNPDSMKYPPKNSHAKHICMALSCIHRNGPPSASSYPLSPSPPPKSLLPCISTLQLRARTKTMARISKIIRLSYLPVPNPTRKRPSSHL